MSQGTPRKFSEKIAILEKKQNEEQEMFHSVMRDVRAITSNKTSPPASCPTTTYPCSQSSGFSDAQCSTVPSQLPCGSPSTLTANSHPLAFSWNRSGGSLPNVHQMVEQPFNNQNWNRGMPTQGHQVRTRSPGAHYHPYMNRGYPASGMKGSERVPPLENHMMVPNMHLQPPDPTWSRARSDPTIHANAMTASNNMHYQLSNLQQQSISINQNSLPWSNIFDYQTGGSCTMPQFTNFAQYPGQQIPLYNNSGQQGQQFAFTPSPLQQMSNAIQQHQSRSSMQSQHPINIQSSSTNLVNGENSINSLATMHSSLPNHMYNDGTSMLTNTSVLPSNNPGIPISLSTTDSAEIKNSNYQQNAFRIPTGLQLNQQQFCNQQLAAGGINSSQSAPTSPAQGGPEAPIRQQWPPARHYSASPDTLDIPNIVLTGADGTLDCFQDLQDLHLDNEIQQLLNNPNSNEQMDPALETQLLN